LRREELLRLIRMIRAERPDLIPYQIALQISLMTEKHYEGRTIADLIQEHDL